jgi:hypothetical protein
VTVDVKLEHAYQAQAPDVDEVREEAARCAEETARWERSVRAKPLRGEFSDDAFGVAGEAAIVVLSALKAAGAGFSVDLPWDLAAGLLRAGWQRGQAMEINLSVAGAS